MCHPRTLQEIFGKWSEFFGKSRNVISLLTQHYSLFIFFLAGEAIILYVSSNQTKSGQYRLWRQSSDGSKEWSNLFAFSAFIKPSGNFTYPLYVFAAGGSPYWRQYISASPSPPSVEYRLDYMFYCSQTSLPGTLQYHVLEAGSVPVIRSYVSKSKNVSGWKYKELSFFARKPATGGDKTR